MCLSLCVCCISFQETDPHCMSLLIYPTDDHSLRTWPALKWKMHSKAEFTYAICLILDSLINICEHEELSPKPRNQKTQNQICHVIMRLSFVAAPLTGSVAVFTSHVTYFAKTKCFSLEICSFSHLKFPSTRGICSQNPSVIHCHWSSSHAITFSSLRGCFTFTNLD